MADDIRTVLSVLTLVERTVATTTSGWSTTRVVTDRYVLFNGATAGQLQQVIAMLDATIADITNTPS